MNRFVLAVGLLSGGWALACEGHYGSHGHGGGGFAIHVGHLAFDLHFGHPQPCEEVVVVQQPQVIVVQAPPPQVVVMEPQAIGGGSPPASFYDVDDGFSPPPVVVAPAEACAPPIYVAPQGRAAVVVPISGEVREVQEVEAAPVGPARLALKYMPGMSSHLGFDQGFEVGGFGFTQTAGIELRLGRFFALRTDGELRQDGRSLDVLGLKFALLPNHRLRPYGSVSLSLSDAPNTGNRIHVGLVGAAGLDLYFGRHFFIEAEVRYRRVPGCCADEGRLTALIGAGVAFF